MEFRARTIGGSGRWRGSAMEVAVATVGYRGPNIIVVEVGDGPAERDDPEALGYWIDEHDRTGQTHDGMIASARRHESRERDEAVVEFAAAKRLARLSCPTAQVLLGLVAQHACAAAKARAAERTSDATAHDAARVVVEQALRLYVPHGAPPQRHFERACQAGYLRDVAAHAERMLAAERWYHEAVPVPSGHEDMRDLGTRILAALATCDRMSNAELEALVGAYCGDMLRAFDEAEFVLGDGGMWRLTERGRSTAHKTA